MAYTNEKRNITYGNKYVYNTEVTNIVLSKKDLLTVALDFLDSRPDYDKEEFITNDKLPDDWYDSVFWNVKDENGNAISQCE